ncbi:MAG: hypothetical protein AAF791_02815, partial [Bacteroidota bacterium]
EAARDADGLAGALPVAEAWGVIALAWDGALRPLLDASGFQPYFARVADPDGDGRVQPEHMAAIGAAVASAVSVGFVAAVLAPFVSRVAQAYREAEAHTDRLPAVAAWRAIGTPQGPTPPAVVGAVLGGSDRAGLAWLRRYSGYWIATAHARLVEPRIAEIAASVLSESLSLDDAAERMADTLRDVQRRGVTYWRLVADSAVARAQAFGRASALERAGVDGGYVSIVDDDRTSAVSRFMAGRLVALSTIRAVRDRLLAETEPEGWKRASPWWREADVEPGGALRRLVESAPVDERGVHTVPPEAGLIPWHPYDRDVLIVRPPTD